MKRIARKVEPRTSARDDARSAYRKNLLAAAEQVFVGAGFGASKMADIAREAGVSVGTLYNYFDSKEAIYEALMAERSTAFRAEIEPLVALDPPLASVEAIVRKVCSHIEQNGALFMLFLERGGASELDVERVGGAGMRSEYDVLLTLFERAVGRAVAAGALRRDVPVHTQVAMLTGGMNGAFYAWFKRKRRVPIQHVADDLLALFFAGARIPS